MFKKKRKVGRPSNASIRREKNKKIFMFLFALTFVGVSLYSVSDYMKGNSDKIGASVKKDYDGKLYGVTSWDCNKDEDYYRSPDSKYYNDKNNNCKCPSGYALYEKDGSTQSKSQCAKYVSANVAKTCDERLAGSDYKGFKYCPTNCSNPENTGEIQDQDVGKCIKHYKEATEWWYYYKDRKTIYYCGDKVSDNKDIDPKQVVPKQDRYCLEFTDVIYTGKKKAYEIYKEQKKYGKQKGEEEKKKEQEKQERIQKEREKQQQNKQQNTTSNNNDTSTNNNSTSPSGNIKNASVSSIPDQEYTGKKIKPKFTVTLNGYILEKGKDYKVKYTNNKKVGTAKIKITGIGNFKGTKKVKFNIVKTMNSNEGVITDTNSTNTDNSSGNVEPQATEKVNGVKIQIDVNGGKVDGVKSEYGQSGSLVTQNGNTIIDAVAYGSKLGTYGLTDPDSKKELHITKKGYKVEKASAYKCKSGCTTKDKVYSAEKQYKASDFCDASKSDCIVTLKVNWKKK